MSRSVYLLLRAGAGVQQFLQLRVHGALQLLPHHFLELSHPPFHRSFSQTWGGGRSSRLLSHILNRQKMVRRSSFAPGLSVSSFSTAVQEFLWVRRARHHHNYHKINYRMKFRSKNIVKKKIHMCAIYICTSQAADDRRYMTVRSMDVAIIDKPGGLRLVYLDKFH